MAHNAHTAGERIEQLLAGLPAGRGRDTAEELARLLIEMYGTGLGRVVALLNDTDPELVHRLAGDELVESLLLLHDLHPLDVDTRVQRALDRVRPYLGSHAGGVTYLGVDETGVARLRLEGNCHGCPSSTLTVTTAIEGAILEAAPEVVAVDVAGMTEEAKPAALLQVGMGPPPGWVAEGGAARVDWVTLPEIGPPTGRPVRVEAGGAQVLVCSVRGTLYAYRDACAGCGAELSGAALSGDELTCPSCAARFDVRLAGRGVNGTTHHLDPVPLLSDSQGVRVAVPKAVVS